jgi:hypothetical protein
MNAKLKLAAVLVAAAAGSACGTATGQTTDLASLPTGGDVASVSAAAGEVRSEVQRFYDSWEGGLTGNQAAEVLISYGRNGDYSECMAAKGFDVPWQSTISAWSEPDALLATRWLRDPNYRSWEQYARDDAHNLLAEQAHDKEISEAEQQAGIQCDAQRTEMSDAEADAMLHPPGYDKLKAEWDLRTEAAVTAVAGPPEKLEDCLAGQAMPGKLAGEENVDAVIDFMESRMPGPADVPGPSETATEQWQQYMQYESQLMQARWACAGPVYEEGLTAVLPVIESLQRDFPDELAALQEHWAKLQADASELGWSAANPYAN